MIDSILTLKEDSYGKMNFGQKKKNYDLMNILKNRNIAIASTSSLEPNPEAEKVRDTILAKSRKFYSNNKRLLNNLVTAKIASIMKKGEWEDMIGDEDHKIRTIIQNYISRFEIFKTTFVSANRQLTEEIKLFLRDNLQKFMREKLEAKSRDSFLQEMKEMAMSIEELIVDKKNLKKSVESLNKEISDLEMKRLEMIKQIELMKNEIEELNKIRTRRSGMVKSPKNSGKSRNKLENIDHLHITPNLRLRGRGVGFDIIEYSKAKSQLGSNLINPIVVIKAKIANIKEEIGPLQLQIEELERKAEIKKHLLNQCRTLALANTQILLSSPDILLDIDFNIIECIMNKYRLMESCLNDQIGGDFTNPEKNYLINCSKLELKWREFKIQKKNSKNFSRRGTSLGNYRSDLIYPSPEKTKVNLKKTLIFNRKSQIQENSSV